MSTPASPPSILGISLLSLMSLVQLPARLPTSLCRPSPPLLPPSRSFLPRPTRSCRGSARGAPRHRGRERAGPRSGVGGSRSAVLGSIWRRRARFVGRLFIRRPPLGRSSAHRGFADRLLHSWSRTSLLCISAVPPPPPPTPSGPATSNPAGRLRERRSLRERLTPWQHCVRAAGAARPPGSRSGARLIALRAGCVVNLWLHTTADLLPILRCRRGLFIPSPRAAWGRSSVARRCLSLSVSVSVSPFCGNQQPQRMREGIRGAAGGQPLLRARCLLSPLRRRCF
jgi:hypothetical protein